MADGRKCDYRFDDGEACLRLPDRKEDRYCLFHSQPPISIIGIKRFWWRLKILALRGDGDWRGFNFPTVNIEKFSCPAIVDARGASFQSIFLSHVIFEKPVDISQCKIHGSVRIQGCKFSNRLAMENVHFLDCDFSHIVVSEEFVADDSIFSGNFKATGVFSSRASFIRCHFSKKAHFFSTKSYTLSVSSGVIGMSSTGANLVVTKGPTHSHIEKIIALFRSLYDLLYVRLKKLKRMILMTIFAYRDRLLEMIKRSIRQYREKVPHTRKGVTSYYLFGGAAFLNDMTFSEPKEVVFKGVNLQNASFRGTDLRGVTFIGNNWYQPELKRNGLIEDVRLRDINNYYDKKEPLPDLENSYRNIRFSLEANKDFGLANDFFVGEMDAKRSQLSLLKSKMLSVLALYRVISNYGTSPIRCLTWFLFLLVCHALSISYLSNAHLYLALIKKFSDIEYCSSNRISDWAGQVSGALAELLEHGCLVDSIIYSTKTMTLQKDKAQLLNGCLEMNAAVMFTDTIFSILGPILLGLIAITVRTRIKRN